jgi:hypothetical protein
MAHIVLLWCSFVSCKQQQRQAVLLEQKHVSALQASLVSISLLSRLLLRYLLAGLVH